MDWLLLCFRTTLLTIHVLSNALAGGALLLSPFLAAPEGDRRRLAWIGWWGLGVGLLTGGLSGLLVLGGGVSGYEAAALRLAGSAYTMFAAEWTFTAALYAVYLFAWRPLARRRALHGFIAVAAATNLLYHFPTLMIVLGWLATDPGLSQEAILHRADLRELIFTPHAFGRTVHFWGLSLLAAGVACQSHSRGTSQGALISLSGALLLFFSGCQAIFSHAARARVLDLYAASGWFLLGGVTCWLLIVSSLALEIASGGRTRHRDAGLTIVAALLMVAASLSNR